MGLLTDVRVLDLTNVLAGPLCCYQLAQLGAEVIKVEEPQDGDLARQLGVDPELNARQMGISFLAQNAGKKSVAIDLKSDVGKSVFLNLVDTADVVVENFRPGVMDRLGLASQVLRARNPRLVYCAISGFGQDGPLRDNPAYDQIIQGLSGMMSVTGDAGSAPLRAGYPAADTTGGITAAFAVAAALVRQARTGLGETIDVSMLEAALVSMGWNVSNYLNGGVAPVPMGNENMTAAPSGTFRTADGLLNIAANRQVQFERLCGLVGRPDLTSDPRFAQREDRKRHRAALTREIEAALASRTAAEWAAACNRLGIPSGEVLSVPEALNHPQLAQRDFIRRFEGVPEPGRSLSVSRAGFRLESGDPGPDGPPPRLGEHNQEILAPLLPEGVTLADLAPTGRA